MTSIYLATSENIARLEPMVAAFHDAQGIKRTTKHRINALEPLLSGSPHGAVYLIGTQLAPMGYIAVTFTWSIELGGLEAIIDEFYIRDTVRGRGIGTQVLIKLSETFLDYKIARLSLDATNTNDQVAHFYERLGFQIRQNYKFMALALTPDE
jgi:GNAT superfamily N-acetyltransferase